MNLKLRVHGYLRNMVFWHLMHLFAYCFHSYNPCCLVRTIHSSYSYFQPQPRFAGNLNVHNWKQPQCHYNYFVSNQTVSCHDFSRVLTKIATARITTASSAMATATAASDMVLLVVDSSFFSVFATSEVWLVLIAVEESRGAEWNSWESESL